MNRKSHNSTEDQIWEENHNLEQKHIITMMRTGSQIWTMNRKSLLTILNWESENHKFNLRITNSVWESPNQAENHRIKLRITDSSWELQFHLRITIQFEAHEFSVRIIISILESQTKEWVTTPKSQLARLSWKTWIKSENHKYELKITSKNWES
jgi:hypothetical protein